MGLCNNGQINENKYRVWTMDKYMAISIVYGIYWTLCLYVHDVRADTTPTVRPLFHWSVSEPTDKQTVAILREVGIYECIDVCREDDRCTYIKYHQNAGHLCYLIHTAVTDMWSLAGAGVISSTAIYWHKSDWTQSNPTQCNSCQNPSHRLGCGPIPSLDNFTTLGNQMYVGATVKYVRYCRLEPNWSESIVCQDNGVWSTPRMDPATSTAWFVVFRAVAGNGDGDVYHAWLNSTAVTADVTCCGVNSRCTKHYRNPALDDWSTLGITKVKFSYYKGRFEVLYVVFDGTGSTLTDWFNETRIIESSYPDLAQRQFNFYSIAGDIPYTRRFFINIAYAGCSDDTGYVIAVEPRNMPCPFENRDKYPLFLYSTVASHTVWTSTDTGEADSLVVSVSKN